MKKISFSLSLILLSVIVFADTPGKKSMSDSKITFKKINHFGEYTFYWKGEYDSALVVAADTTLMVPRSGGKPMSAMFWGINKKTNELTDTLFLENYYSPDYVITLDTVYGNKLNYSKKEISNSNSSGDGGLAADYKDNGNSSDRFSKIAILSGTSIIALIFLVWYYIKRKAKEKNTEGMGSWP